MKVLHVVHGYWPATGGSQWFVKNLSEHLVAGYGDEVTVFTTTAYSNHLFWRRDQPEMPAGIEQINGVTVRRFSVFNRFGKFRFYVSSLARRLRLPGYDWLLAIYNGPLIRGMSAAIARSNVDIVSATAFPLLHMNYAVWGARRGGLAVVLTGAIHTLDTWGYDRPLIYKTMRRADRVITYTNYERDFLVERGVSSKRIDVIGLGVDAEAYARADGASMRARLGWSDEPVVITLVKHELHKRIDTVIQAMRLIWERHPEARLLIVGERTVNSYKVDTWIEELPDKQRERVTKVETFTQEEKVAMLSASDVLVLASQNESFGIVFVEAWACGKPVIGIRTGSIASLIEDEVDGMLVTYDRPDEMARALDRLLTDPLRRKRMGEAGRRKVLNNYTWKIIAQRFRDSYMQAIDLVRASNRIGKS